MAEARKSGSKNLQRRKLSQKCFVMTSWFSGAIVPTSSSSNVFSINEIKTQIYLLSGPEVAFKMFAIKTE
jgi:hypothetical protein